MHFVRRTFTGTDVQKPTLRAAIAKLELSAAEAQLYDVPLETWRDIDRSQLAGYRPSDPNPVDPMRCPPVDSQHPLLKKLSVFSGPVTKLAADAIVNAANEVALGGGGVDGAVHAGAGRLLRRECATFPCCPTGECFITKGYNLPARYVLHTVGPRGEHPEYLQSAYRSVLSLVKANRLRTVGICGISTGVYGYPLEPATHIAIEEVMTFLKTNAHDIDRICLACFTDAEKAAATLAIDAWKHRNASV